MYYIETEANDRRVRLHISILKDKPVKLLPESNFPGTKKKKPSLTAVTVLWSFSVTSSTKNHTAYGT